MGLSARNKRIRRHVNVGEGEMNIQAGEAMRYSRKRALNSTAKCPVDDGYSGVILPHLSIKKPWSHVSM